eukprot:GHVS01062330.1.p1 GENE.GHVS01062330.1~~GHVS01062330.1.p1  ORF type:complete len:248 (-),score=22.84 GHVS01062330.1:221-964(-)
MFLKLAEAGYLSDVGFFDRYLTTMRKKNDFQNESFSLYSLSSPNSEGSKIESDLTGHIGDSDVEVYFWEKQECGKDMGCHDKAALVLELAMSGQEARAQVNVIKKSWIQIEEGTPFSVTTLSDERNDLRLINVVATGVKRTTWMSMTQPIWIQVQTEPVEGGSDNQYTVTMNDDEVLFSKSKEPGHHFKSDFKNSWFEWINNLLLSLQGLSLSSAVVLWKALWNEEMKKTVLHFRPKGLMMSLMSKF